MGVTYDADELLDILSDVQVVVPTSRASANGKAPKASAREIFLNYKDVIPSSVAARLRDTTATGDRSRVLWKMVCGLLEAGLTPGEVVVLVERSPWNKFSDDRSRLWADVNKAAGRIVTPQSKEPARKSRAQREDWVTPLDRYLAVESTDPTWMIDGLWSDKSHGIIAGEPKTRKSYVAIDIALSVATGTKCLDAFEVSRPGPVMLIQEEISDSEMRKRLRYIATAKGLSGEVTTGSSGISLRLPDPVPLYLRNRKQFDLTDTELLATLNLQIHELGIKLVILDPLQMMLGEADENKASSVRPILQNLLKLKENTGCGIMIVHHYGKQSATNPRNGGQRMLGSQAFHGWVESALYLSKDEKNSTIVEREFRNFDAVAPFRIDYVGSDDHYEVDVVFEESKRRQKVRQKSALDKYVAKHPGCSISAIAKLTGKSARTITRHAERSPFVTVETQGTGRAGRPRRVLQPR